MCIDGCSFSSHEQSPGSAHPQLASFAQLFWESSRLTLPYQRALALRLFFTITDTLSSAFVDMLPSVCGRVPPWRDA